MVTANQIKTIYEKKELSDRDKSAVLNVIRQLDDGQIRVAEQKAPGQWVVHDWIKMAILLYFRIMQVRPMEAGEMKFVDKVPLKTWIGHEGVRVVPPAVVRTGAYIERGAVLMPSFINIGARVGAESMVDTWATVGSCAQVGSRVHLAGGAGLGGVLEPLQASPVIVEDDVFIGSRCVVVEGAMIEAGSVLGAGCVITGSTKIIDARKAHGEMPPGRIPPRSVVIPGVTQKTFASGVSFGIPCALIIGERNAKTDLKTSLNQALRDIQSS